ncbi:MAG: hypothetical protein CK425_05540 [Parachlamydia sp.]|nr:MAG: hypothetical protein CK425_05540 [Parachlamydia sp.]
MHVQYQNTPTPNHLEIRKVEGSKIFFKVVKNKQNRPKDDRITELSRRLEYLKAQKTLLESKMNVQKKIAKRPVNYVARRQFSPRMTVKIPTSKD